MAAKSIWVDQEWFVEQVGTVLEDSDWAYGADGGELEVAGRGSLTFTLSGRRFMEDVRVMKHLPALVLLGTRFWRRYVLSLDLSSNTGSISVGGRRFHGSVKKPGPSIEYVAEPVRKNIEDAEVDQAILDMDLSSFSTNEEMRKELRDLLWSHRDIFKGLGKIKDVQHHIKLKDGANPVCSSVRRRSPREEELERKQMEKLLRLGVLETSISPWAANNVFVPKKDGGFRVTPDFRSLNNATITDSYPMEDVRETLDWLGSKRVFSTFNVKDEFFQVELDGVSRPLTAIRTVLGLLQYTRLPQGLKNSPGTFQRIVNNILGGRKGKDVLAYMDDTNVGNEMEEEHLESLRSILDELYKAGVRLKLSKCEFGVREITVLGHRVGPEGLQPSAQHVAAINASGDELMRFLGLVNYFSSFVDHFAEIARPLYDVLKGTGFSKRKRPGQKLRIPDWDNRWGAVQRASWMALKEALSDPQILASPVRGAPKKVMTDASSFGVGAVLLQQSEDGTWKPVSFTSKQLKKAELSYRVHQKECLAVVHALRKWRHYLHGEKFVVVTDHMSLKWLLSLREPTDRLARWVLEIQDFDFTITYAKGTTMVVPDTLSRDAVLKPLCQRCYSPLRDGPDEEVEGVQALAECAVLGAGLDDEDLRTAQAEEFGDVRTHASDKKGMLVDEEGVLRIFKDGDLAAVVPKKLRPQVIFFVHGTHLTGHYRFRRTAARMRGRFWWDGWQDDLVTSLKGCLSCAVSEDTKPGKQVRLEVVHPRRRFSHVAFDLQTITPKSKDGNTKVLAIIDVFTRYVRAVAVPNEKAETIANVLLDDWVSLFGPMERLLSDQGPSLIGKVVTNMAEMLGIKHLKAYPLHPEANGTVERWNRTLMKDVSSFMATGRSDWDEHIALACFRYNSSVRDATGMSPFKAMFGVDAFEAWSEVDLKRAEDDNSEGLAMRLSRLHKTLVLNASRARQRAAKQYDRSVRETQYEIGHRVVLWSTELAKREGNKIFKPWIGPYVVKGRLGRLGYELESEVGNPIARVHANRLRKIDDAVRETGDPEDGVFPDGLRTLRKLAGSEVRVDPSTGKEERWFKIQISGRKSPRWTRKADLPEVVVKLFDMRTDTGTHNKNASRRRSESTAEDRADVIEGVDAVVECDDLFDGGGSGISTEIKTERFDGFDGGTNAPSDYAGTCREPGGTKDDGEDMEAREDESECADDWDDECELEFGEHNCEDLTAYKPDLLCDE